MEAAPDDRWTDRAETLEQLERDRLRVALDASSSMAGGYVPTISVILAVMVASHDLGQGIATFVVSQLSLLALIVTVLLARRRGGVTALRLRGLPGSLTRSFLPLAVFGVVAIPLVAATFGWSMRGGDPSFTLLGVTCGAALAVTGTWSWRRFSAEAQRLATEVGLAR